MDYIPVYAALPLSSFLSYWKECMRLLHASMQGISALRAMPNAIRLLRDVPAHVMPPSDEPVSLEDAEARAAFAEKECAAGFPILHAHTFVGCWSAFEVAIEDTCVGLLINEPSWLQNDAFARLRIPLAEFETLEKDERMRLLLQELQRAQGPNERRGTGAFEFLLKHFDLSGEIGEELKRTIWEMHNVRNVIIHRGSVADRRLVQGCPWLGLKIGEKVVVTHKSLSQYGNALCEYVFVLSKRLALRYGIDVEARMKQFDQDQVAG